MATGAEKTTMSFGILSDTSRPRSWKGEVSDHEVQ